MKSIQKVKKLRGVKVLLRTDFDVPLDSDSSIHSEDGYRIEKSLQTIAYLKKMGARVIIISHIGRDKKNSLKKVAEYISKKIKITFVEGHTQDFVHEIIDTMKDGDVVLLENLRQDPGEVSNSSAFARGLARLADIYVNDSFAVCHRRHASIVGIPKFLPSYAGIQLEEEVKHLEVLLRKPKRPFVFVLGGAKFDTKLPLIKKYLKMADIVFVGGALQNNFFKAQGLEVGKSLVDTKRYNLGGLMKTGRLILPQDVVVVSKQGTRICAIDEVKKTEKIVDIGPKTIRELSDVIASSKMVLWNGPLGWYEEGFSKGTESFAKVVAKDKVFSIVGGGDTVVTLKKLKLQKKINFVSTGGGSMLEFLEKGKLPGITAL